MRVKNSYVLKPAFFAGLLSDNREQISFYFEIMYYLAGTSDDKDLNVARRLIISKDAFVQC